MEEALRCTGLGAVVAELSALDLTQSRRLQLAAEKSGIPALVIRRGGRADQLRLMAAQPIAAGPRWRIGPAPSVGVAAFPHPALPGPARWQIELWRCRGGRPGVGWWRNMMMDGEKRRFLSLWLPRWPTDRWWRRRRQQQGGQNPAASARPAEEPPLLLVQSSGNLRLVHAADDMALSHGLFPGQRLADALACVPRARVEPADPAGDLAALHQLAQWATRFSPHATPDAPDGLLLDITGCGHLWQGEDRLMCRCAGAAYAHRASCARCHCRHHRRGLGQCPVWRR